MYLSKLELLGFKSFAQKTNIAFTDGITSIVGPNGCGKTNIVDAIRWCLGEQRTGALRSDKMENVIFNGTSSKKPMGMSEVSLTIQNTKRILPTEYSEVTITRRIFRSGESEYLLNKNICRLKDITNLFMDTGIGANAYSVIELKMVETILSSKAEERRTMFEEAAGVNKYKLRRRLALRKLEEVKVDLNRVNDIVAEIEKKVHSLERQAKKADKYNRISSSLRELEIDLAEKELALFNRDRNVSRNSRETDAQKKILLESRLNELEEKIKTVKQELSAMEQKLKDKRAEVSSITGRIYDAEKNISVAEERKKSLEANIIRYKTEIEELNNQSDNYNNTISRSKTNKIEIQERYNSDLQAKAELEISSENSRNLLEGKRNELKAESERLLESIKDITNLENELLNIGKLFNTQKESINKANGKIQLLTGNIAKTVGYIGELEQEKSKTEIEIGNTESEYIRKQKEKEDLEKKLDELKTAELENKGIINSLKEKISFIQNLIDNLEGISKGAKVLISNSQWAKGDKILAAHAGSSSEELHFAVEAALKNNLNNILIETIDDLQNGIAYLRSNSKGKASFYLNRETSAGKNIFERIGNFISERKIKSIRKERGFRGWASELIQTEEKWKPFFNKILNKTAVVDTFENALQLSGRYPAFNFTTLNGDYFDSSGVIEGGSLPKEDDSIFGRKQFLQKLGSELPRREQDLEKIQINIEKVQEELNAIDLKVISDQGRLLVNDLTNIEKQIAQFQFEMKKSSDEVEKIRFDIQDSARESNRLDNEMQRINSMLNIQKDEKQRADLRREKLENHFRNIEDEYNSITAKLNNINLELERLNGEMRNSENSARHSLESIESINKSIEKRNLDISISSEELESVKNQIKDKNNLLSEYNLERNRLLKEKNEIDEQYSAIREKINELENTRNSIRNERELIVENIHSSEMKLNELGLKIENLKEHIRESYSHSLEINPEKDYELDSFNFRERSDEVQTLKEQIKNLGPINLLAYSEFEEEKERFEFLTKQRNDLLESEKDIARTIEEINTAAQTKFTETFEKIRENFIRIFRNLFNPGDEADLRLEESAAGVTDPLEAKIEIIAKPKGKRPTSIELLSGGEKTLTAIALLFAIYLVKPSPFCILDEIDAPLDDANIDRFTKIIKDFSKDTQFIVVTHNKRTMEAADTLYGVTMQEEGVSKLVSVRFNEQLSAVS